jgi:hypothetical protein
MPLPINSASYWRVWGRGNMAVSQTMFLHGWGDKSHRHTRQS